MLNRKVKIEFSGNTPTVHGKIHKVIHPEGPAWPAFFQINVGTDEEPKLLFYYEYGWEKEEIYELSFV